MHYQCERCGAVFSEWDAVHQTGRHESDASAWQTWPECPACGCDSLTELPDGGELDFNDYRGR
jgi:predicted  nucleic acid-binding Zn-ribbon protein